MEINGLNHIFPALSSLLNAQREERPELISSLSNVVVAPAANRQDAALIEAQRLLNDTLRGLNPAPQSTTLLRQAFNNLPVREQIDLLSQTNISLGDSLINLGIPRQDALLIAADALIRLTLENIAASREVRAAQSEALITQTLNQLGAPAITPAVEPAVFPSLDNSENSQGTQGTQAAAELAASAAGPNKPAAELPPESQPAAPPQSLQTAVPETAGVTANAPPEIIPEPPFLIPDVDPTPFGIAVYKVNRQRLTTLEPEPISKKIKPVKEGSPSGIIGELFFRHPREAYSAAPPPPFISREHLPEEGQVREMINRFNAEQAQKNIPIHLVLSQKKEGLTLDIYDCSDNYSCKTVYDTPLNDTDLTGLMENLSQRVGFFVNTKR